MSGQLSTISRNQKYFRTRENRNFSTVRSTEKRILNLNLIESGMMVTMAGLQVFVVRFFFTGARKGECRVYQYSNLSLTIPRIRIDYCCTMRTGDMDRSRIYHLCKNHDPFCFSISCSVFALLFLVYFRYLMHSRCVSTDDRLSLLPRRECA